MTSWRHASVEIQGSLVVGVSIVAIVVVSAIGNPVRCVFIWIEDVRHVPKKLLW